MNDWNRQEPDETPDTSPLDDDALTSESAIDADLQQAQDRPSDQRKDEILAGCASRGREGPYEVRHWHEYVYVETGDGYFIRAFGDEHHFSGHLGFNYIAKLIATPGVPVPMRELEGQELQRTLADPHSPQPIMDNEAIQAAKRSWTDLEGELEKALDDNDSSAAERIRIEKTKLEQQVLRDTGRTSTGQRRDLNNPFEKIRPRIHSAMNTAYKKLRKAGPSMQRLADHLKKSIGATESDKFVYIPSGVTPEWHFEI